jgi:acetyl esterase/lipase
MSLEEMDRVRAGLLARRGETLTLHERRARFEAQMGAIPLPEDAHVEAVEIHAGLGARWYWTDGCDASRAVLWLHGGAFFLGSSASYADFAVRLARASGARVLVPDYRLVPEHVFPAATVDTAHALDWLEREGFDMARVAIGGDSCGGNLAAGAVQGRIEAGKPLPAAAVLLSPYLDLTHSGASIAARAHLDPFVEPEGMPGTARAYLGDVDPKDPRASPLFGPVEGFPPTLVLVGSDECLFDDAHRFAARLPRAVFQEWVGMIHVWPMFAGAVEEGRWAHGQMGAFVHRELFQA